MTREGLLCGSALEITRLNDISQIVSAMTAQFEGIHSKLIPTVWAMAGQLRDVRCDLEQEKRIFFAEQRSGSKHPHRRFSYFVTYSPFITSGGNQRVSLDIERSLASGGQPVQADDQVLQHLHLSTSVGGDKKISFWLDGRNDNQENDTDWVSRYIVLNPTKVAQLMVDARYSGDQALSNDQLLLAMEHLRYIYKSDLRRVWH